MNTQGGAHLYQAARGPGSASSGTVRLRSSGGKMGSAVGVFSAVLPYISSLSSLFVPLSAARGAIAGLAGAGTHLPRDRSVWVRNRGYDSSGVAGQ